MPMPEPRSIHTRRVRFDFSAPLPRHWLGGRRVATHLINTLGLMLPPGERFFVRTTRDALEKIADPVLREQARAFMGQEGRHAVEHQRSFQAIEAQGYEVNSFIERMESLIARVLEPNLPLSVRISATAALEHFTATIAELGFSTPYLDDADPMMRDLFLWHAAEEIEHKSVAFDLLQHLDPAYRMRVVGLALATPVLFFAWWGGTWRLMRQEPSLPARTAAKEMLEALLNGDFKLGPLARAMGSYLRPSFHPAEEDNYHRVEQHFATH